MTNKQELFNAFQHASQELLHILQEFPVEKFNELPGEGAWSAAMVADHLLQLEKRIRHIIISPAKTTERSPDEKLPLIKLALQNLTVKYKAPSFIIPSNTPLEQEWLIGQLKEQKELLVQQADLQDLSELCTDFPHNRLGELTRMEWMWFNIYHTERHLEQLKNIAANVLGTPGQATS